MNKPTTQGQPASNSSYSEFLKRKLKFHGDCGIDVQVNSPHLFPFQNYATSWALKKGKCCLFAGTGLGKTRMQAVFASQVGGIVLILAPLAVAGQTVAEAESIGVRVQYIQSPDMIGGDGIYITNYDRVELFADVNVNAVILDESSIIKSHDGKYRNYLQERFKDVPFKLCLSATPAPNDYMELGTHAEFVGAMSRPEMLATYFTHDGGDTAKWRLKGHARKDFFDWVSTWALMFTHPRDIGFDQHGYDLPELRVHNHVIDTGSYVTDNLFGEVNVNAANLHSLLQDTAEERAAKALEIISEEPDDEWIVWVNTDKEQDAIMQLINGFESVRGSDKPDHKEDRLLGFGNGKYKRLVTKPKIAGYGMNWQRCSRMIFCGVNYSFEQQYQAVRRCYRFGQSRPVDVHYVTCSNQEKVMSAVKFKEQSAKSMVDEMRSFQS